MRLVEKMVGLRQGREPREPIKGRNSSIKSEVQLLQNQLKKKFLQAVQDMISLFSICFEQLNQVHMLEHQSLYLIYRYFRECLSICSSSKKSTIDRNPNGYKYDISHDNMTVIVANRIKLIVWILRIQNRAVLINRIATSSPIRSSGRVSSGTVTSLSPWVCKVAPLRRCPSAVVVLAREGLSNPPRLSVWKLITTSSVGVPRFRPGGLNEAGSFSSKMLRRRVLQGFVKGNEME